MKKVYGIGVNDYEGKVTIGCKHIKSYSVWNNMLRRCYDTKFQEKNPTYVGCTVCDEWLSFKNFKEWFDKNYRYELDIRLELDKDLLVEGNKIYSPDNCVFLPKKINSFLTNNQANNTSGVVGVSWHKRDNKFEVRISDFDTHKSRYLGYFTNVEEASKAYELARDIETLKAKEYMRHLGYSEDIINKIR